MNKAQETRILNLFGWFGVVAVASAYTLLLLGFLQSTSVIYLLLNIAGSIAIMLDAWNAKNYQPVALNMFWALVALVSLVSGLL